MADDELDLEQGDPGKTDRLLGGSGSKSTPLNKQRKTVGNSGATRKRSTSAQAAEDKLRHKVTETLDRLAKWREAREDDELATALREDAEAITDGLLSLARALTPFRTVLVFIVAFVQPALAFGRVGRILIGRWYAYQTERRAQQPQAEPQPEQGMPGQPEPVFQ